MQFETIAVLITGSQRDDDPLTPSHARLADDGKVVPILELLRIEGTSSRVRSVSKACDQLAADTLGTSVDAHHLLSGSIELNQPLADLTILDTMPDVMGRKTTVTLVNKGALKALLLLRLPKTLQPVLGFIGMGWNYKPATKQKRK
ncbi:hypothetical protein CF161_30635 [Pseudomonas sp. CF161]|nr:hypothetical protein CF161_30635 [Pseudomonas sp. CF161]